ncbi:SusC/RagA family TonB-linked outer membrane protein [Niastella koreensis]|uniref:TonB-dependent receptor plug n=2 Tax=Niastella koreensis TaxID=354356 RepID=G8TEU4_NIAKG|nr:TonB-dependent receptor [Niastella koreensis]AEW00530.1 TonB-dependent receptor plug [Niastella koreensis GR20-10]OQP52388.1 SusC/RagA family TonB-linked outer membrane protein [Niastella koreensis]
MKCKLLLLVLMLWSCSLFAQEQKVSGTITEKGTGSGLADVSVTVKGTSTGTRTNDKGFFSFQVPRPGDVELEISLVGYVKKQVTAKGGEPLSITLDKEATNLNEVVVIGYGTVKKKDLTGSVASVSGKAISDAPVPNIAQAMQGKLAGVNVVTQDGRPGADVSIRVRGGTSISQSNQPLILIDGVPGNISDVPADQVKSIDVLKDASATAIYGAQGANGVILVTTKGAMAGKTIISYSGYQKWNEPVKYLEALNPYDYLQYVWANAAANGAAYQTPFEKLYGLGANTGTNTGGIDSYKGLATHDPQRDIYNSSISRNHDLTISGGTEKTKVFVSANYLDEQGMKVNSYLKRANLSFKVNHKLFDNVTFSLDTRFVDTRSLGDESTTNGSGSVLSTSYKFRPIASGNILGDQGALTTGNIEQYGKNALWDNFSPAARAGDYFPLTKDQTLRGQAGLNWEVIKGLTAHTDLFFNRGWDTRQYWSGAVYNNYLDDAGNKKFAGNADYRKNDSWQMRWSNTLNYQFQVNEANRFSVLGGYEIYNSGGTGMAIQGIKYPSNFDQKTAFGQINNIDSSGSYTISSNVATPVRINSYFTRVNYTLLDKYLFTFTFRADGSSKFSPTNRWGYFPAGAFAWKMSDESFLKDVSWLDNLKLRASIGEVGNNGISASLWSQSWATVTDQRLQYAINNQRQLAYDFATVTRANPNLKWETTITRDLGIDFAFFKNRLSGTIDVYHNTTKDLLMQATIPGITGFTQTYANIGQTSNKGIELSLNAIVFQNKDWNVSVGGNINWNKSNIDELAGNVNGLYTSAWSGTQQYPALDYVLQQGHPVGLVRGLRYDGFYTTNDFDYNNGTYTLKKGIPNNGTAIGVVHGVPNQTAYPGLPKFRDLDSNGVIDGNDVAVIGNMTPIHTGGFNISASYKGFDLGMYFNWSYGNQIYNANKLASLYGPKEAGVYENHLAILKDAYKIYDVQNGQLVKLTTPDQLNAANANAKLPLAYNEVGVTSTLGIEDGSFLRLNTLMLGYTLPKSIVSKAKISNLRIYGSIYNVFTLTSYSGLDPEVNVDPNHNSAIYPTVGFDFGAYPRPRSYVVGVNLSF